MVQMNASTSINLGGLAGAIGAPPWPGGVSHGPAAEERHTPVPGGLGLMTI